MKRYLAFFGLDYYPEGGMNDFIGDYDTIPEAKEFINTKRLEQRPDDIDWEWCWGGCL